MASQITVVSIVCLTVYWGASQRKRKSSASLVPCEGNPQVTGGLPSHRVSYAENVPFDDVILCSVIKQKWRTFLMSEVRSLGQGLQLVMPEWQPWVADHLASGMSTSLGPPFTLPYNDKKASHLEADFITCSPHPTIKSKAMGWLSLVPCIAKVINSNNMTPNDIYLHIYIYTTMHTVRTRFIQYQNPNRVFHEGLQVYIYNVGIL